MESKEMIQLKQMMRDQAKAGLNPQFGPGADYAGQRAAMENAMKMMPAQPGVTFVNEVIDGVKVEIASPDKLAGNSIIYYIHGGAFAIGSPLGSRAFVSVLSKLSGFVIYSVDYRLAPEYPFPAGSDDCFIVYKALLERHPGEKISVIGESAGATLSLVTTLKAMEAGITLPASVTAYAPATDLTDNIDRSKYAATDISIPADIGQSIRDIYVLDNDPTNPYISPLYGNYEGFPPLKLVVDGGEVLYEDSMLLAEKAKKAGVEVDYQKWDDTFHTFPVMAMYIPEGMQVVEDTVKFMKKYI